MLKRTQSRNTLFRSPLSLATLSAAMLAGSMAIGAHLADARAQTEVVVQYSYGEIFNDTFRQIAEEFSAENPDITVTYRTPYVDYEEGTQRVLREAVTNQLPDVTFQGLNRQRILVERGITRPMDAFIAAETDFEAEGFHQAMFDIGTHGGQVHGLPFAISLPITYWNLDLVRQAGGDPDNLPTTWDGVIELANRIDALGPDINGLTYHWDITGNWLWQAPVFSQGGTMLTEDESAVAFDGPAGQTAIATLARFVTEAKMPNISGADAQAAFAAGRTGANITSTASLARVTGLVGDRFELKTHNFPDIAPQTGRLPAGGNVAMIVGTDEDRLEAAWRFVKFATGPRGAAIMALNTGYIPPNRVANDVYLQDFYVENPNHYTAVSQLPILTAWYAFPGENGLKITDVIKDHLNSIITGQRAQEPQAVLEDMRRDVQELLPRTAG